MVSFAKRVLLLLIFVTFIIILHHTYQFERLFLKFHNRYFAHWEDEAPAVGGFLIRTEKCSIPQTAVMPQYFKDNWRVEKIPDCDYEVRNHVFSDDEETLLFLPKKYNEKCCLREILPTYQRNLSYSLTNCTYTPWETTPVKDIEMFVVACNTSQNFEARIPIKPHVQRKIDFWAKKEKPPNILILGIDSVSRLHALRSLPKTMALLKAMNFLDFKGYHSAGPSTLKNFLPLLMGKKLEEVRKTCALSWNASFDDCPFIWNKFSEANYVTSFLEDGEGSFNWGGQGGFFKPPTDYYIYPLFQALKDMRLASFSPNATWWTREMYTNCVSTETVPEFLLRYTRNLFEKFYNVPLFSFTWLAYPFHEHLYSLGSIDGALEQFFSFFFREYNYILDNTLIIFVSDHGDRTSYFEGASIEGFMERSLPPLLLRIPPSLQRLLPLVHENAMRNTRQLSTPYDIHQTLLHVLNLFVPDNSNNFEKAEDPLLDFSPVSTDRSSLFEVIPRDRSCGSVNIPLKSCVCDTVISDVIANTPMFLRQVLSFVTKELNSLVESSVYRDACQRWRTQIDNVLSFRYLGRVQNKFNYLIVFEASPGKARFEGRLAMDDNSNNNGSSSRTMVLVDQLMRVNPYRNQSYCVGFQNDSDKEMKQFCFCK